jgi:hypothetical protein
MDARVFQTTGQSMNHNFLTLPAEDQKLAYRDAALTLKTEAVILEKDFWVS